MYIDLTEYKEFSKSKFQGEHLTVQVPRKVVSVTTGPGWARLGLDAIVCKKRAIVISALMQGRSFHYAHQQARMTLLLEFADARILRMRLCNGEDMPQKRQPMLLKEPDPLVPCAFAETETELSLATQDITVRIRKDPYQLQILDAAGRVRYSQYTDDLHNVCNDRRRGFKEGEDDKQSALEAALSFPGMECLPEGFSLDAQTGAACFCETVEIQPGEHFYGLGERFGPLDKNGQELLNWTVNPVGVSTLKAYKVVPFFISSRGYGLYFNTPRRIRFSMGDYYFKTYSCQVEDDLLDVFYMAGDAPGDILSLYTGLTGRSAMPPKWAFGVWMSRNSYRSRGELEEVARQLRRAELPCDVLHLDWDYCKGSFDYAFDPARFHNMKECTDGLLEQGFRLSVWQLPYLKEDSPAYREAAERGFLARDESGRQGDPEAGNMGVIDLSDPDAVLWYQGKLKALLNDGVRVIKTDFGENAQDVYQYKRADGRDMHNLYPLLYNDAAYAACQQVHPGDSLVWGRSAYAGCQRYPVYWGGDSDSDYSGMYHSLRGGLSLGLSGFPFWSHDVGGYFCTPRPEVYIRWLQWGMLSPLVRFHGTSAREPWAFGEEAVAQYRKYAALRYSLIEYLYSEALKCTLDGTPLMRALVLDFPDDPTVGGLDTQYMLGRSLLVAPVLNDAPAQRVYLPAGTSWLDLHSGAWYDGGQWIWRDTPMDILPVFLRGGTATPFVEPAQHVGEKPYSRVCLEVCPVGDTASCRLHTDYLDLDFAYRFSGETGLGEITLSATEGIEVDCHINCPDVKRVTINGREAGLARDGRGFVTVKV